MGETKRKKFGGNLPPGGDLVISAERIVGDRGREVEGKMVGPRSRLSGPL